MALNLQSIKTESDVDLEKLAEKIEGYSGADITNVVIFKPDMPRCFNDVYEEAD